MFTNVKYNDGIDLPLFVSVNLLYFQAFFDPEDRTSLSNLKLHSAPTEWYQHHWLVLIHLRGTSAVLGLDMQ